MTPARANIAAGSAAEEAARDPTAYDEPRIRIRPGRRRLSTDLYEVWQRRELLLMLVWRELKVRYKQTVLGVLWAILQPLLMTVVFVVFFGLVVRLPTGDVPYPIFAYSGLLAWVYFSQALSTGTQSLSAHGHVINKVYFPRLILPLANGMVRLIDLAVASIFLFALILYYRVTIGWTVLLAPVLVLELGVLAVGLSSWLSVLHLRYRDIGSLLPVLLQAWMFASPVVYPTALIPAEWRGYYLLNPVAGILVNLRAALTNAPVDLSVFWTTTVIIGVISGVSLWGFNRSSVDVADVF